MGKKSLFPFSKSLMKENKFPVLSCTTNYEQKVESAKSAGYSGTVWQLGLKNLKNSRKFPDKQGTRSEAGPLGTAWRTRQSVCPTNTGLHHFLRRRFALAFVVL